MRACSKKKFKLNLLHRGRFLFVLTRSRERTEPLIIHRELISIYSILDINLGAVNSLNILNNGIQLWLIAGRPRERWKFIDLDAYFN